MPPVDSFPPNLSPLEAARYVGVSESWLNKLRVVGGGPEYVKLGRRIVYPIGDLDSWMEHHRTRSTAHTLGQIGGKP